MPLTLISQKVQGLCGKVDIPGDKSVSHRALMLSSLCVGQSTVEGLLEAEDVLSTAASLRQLGADIYKDETGIWHVWGRGMGGLAEPESVLDMGNAGTGARLMMGIVAAHGFNSFFTGDASLCKRPMARVTEPLKQMGADFVSKSGGRLPLVVKGSDRLIPITYEMPVASAQVKSAILFAGLNTDGVTTIVEPIPCRDHSEKMIKGFGGDISVEPNPTGGNVIKITGKRELVPQHVIVPKDPSSAAFAIVAGLIVPDSEIELNDIMYNPLRCGLIEVLKDMGGDIEIHNQRETAGETLVDIKVKTSLLKGIEVSAEIAPSMIDEYPILAIAASLAEGKTIMKGLTELKVKESDRFNAIINGLIVCGIKVEAKDDEITVYGSKNIQGGATIKANLDHRMAMSFLIMGMVSKEKITIDDASSIATSFPNFVELFNQIGANISEAE